MSPKFRFEVSESATAERKHFTNWAPAVKKAKFLSKRQKHPVYIEVFDVATNKLDNVWYTVSNGRVEPHDSKKEAVA